ncbi:MAG: DUF84 family protein [Candidatus Micrarchaeota archaeon]|nr:DUF84 family protein [Candidatus Micrarchaeota archaeon]MDE1805128.1 DUF84 family protein [Candidatus Micrarchaeota archaeon]
MKVYVGSKNRFKIEAVEDAMRKIGIEADVKGFETDSNVAAQPIGEETFRGAYNRAVSVSKEGADFSIGIESGIEKTKRGYMDFAVVHVITKERRESVATTSYFPLPKAVCELIDRGYELSDAINETYGMKDSKNGISAIGALTEGRISLKDILVHATVLAMYPFYNKRESEK